MENAHSQLPEIEMIPDPYELARGCDAIMILTEWNEFTNIDMEKVHQVMKQPVILDGRNVYNPVEMRKMGFRYRCMGRGTPVK
jgi:UDPglucose 6-dehydrogenase